MLPPCKEEVDEFIHPSAARPSWLFKTGASPERALEIEVVSICPVTNTLRNSRCVVGNINHIVVLDTGQVAYFGTHSPLLIQDGTRRSELFPVSGQASFHKTLKK